MKRSSQLGIVAALTVIASVMVLSLCLVLFDRGRLHAERQRRSNEYYGNQSEALKILDDATDQYHKDRAAGKFKPSEEDARINSKMDLTPRARP